MQEVDGYELNDVVSSNLSIGSKDILSYKKIIQKSTYPIFGQSLDLDKAKEVISLYENNSGDLFNIIELMVFFVECGTHFSGDFGGDIGEEFYEVLENTFEEMLKKVKKEENKLYDTYSSRIKAIIRAAEYSGYGYDDQLKDYWEEIFGSCLR